VALLVADSGPLIALSRLDLLGLPARLAQELLVTATVWDEVTRAPGRAEALLFATAWSSGWLTVLPDPEASDSAWADLLDEGERSALTLALQRGATVLVDELRGRAVTARLGLRVVGTLGLLLAARERGLVGPLRPLVERLQGSGYYLSRRLVEQVLASDGG
jgi:predicted nucleic acid-binding protein